MNYEAAFAFLLNLSVQFALLVIVAYAVILVFRIRDSNVRYGIWLSVLLGCGALLLFLVIKPPPSLLPPLRSPLGSPLRTETGDINRIKDGSAVDFRTDAGLPNAATEPQPKVDVRPSGDPTETASEHEQRFLFDLYLILVLLWLSGVLWQLVRFGRGSYLLLRLFSRSMQVSDARIEALVEEIAGEIGIKRGVASRTSSEIQGPVSLGFFKPVIILPHKVAETLSEEELRMVVIHELAHIKRLDFAVNLIQSLLGIALYFHPAFYLLKARLARERESICDDWVVYMTGKRSAYARCLMNIKENGADSVFGTAIFRARENLGRRIKMILDERRSLKIQMPRAMLVILAILACISIPLIATVQPVSSNPEPESASPSNVSGASDAGLGENVIVDPETGLKYTKIGTLTGKNDLITSIHEEPLSLSPNGRFLVWYNWVVPLDGRDTFELMDIPTRYSVLSPDGEKLVFNTGEAIWIVPISPETGHATGPAKKLCDGKYSFGRYCWSPDSEKIVIKDGEEGYGDIRILSVKDGALTQITDPPVQGWFPRWSPDGKTIAYCWHTKLEVIPAEGGTPRTLIKKGSPVPFSWSPDSEWLAYVQLADDSPWRKPRFLHLADGREFAVSIPEGKVGDFLSWSPDGEKMLFYLSSHDWISSLKVVPSSGGRSSEPATQLRLWASKQFWSPDSGMIVAEGGAVSGWGFLITSLSGGDPLPLELDVSVAGYPDPFSLSPDCRKLAFLVGRGDGTADLYVVPVSLKDGRTTGPEAIVFRRWYPKATSFDRAFSWSPDGAKVALSHNGDIWMTSADGGVPVQVTTKWVFEYLPVWSPDGEMIKYEIPVQGREGIKRKLRVIPASGSEDTVILDVPGIGGAHCGAHCWSADSKYILFRGVGREIRAISVADGRSRQIIDFKDLDIEDAWGLSISPDGRKLAFLGSKGVADLIYWASKETHIFIGPAEGGEFAKLAADDTGGKNSLFWSPDGKWISYNSYGFVKTRPEGAIWEADVSELLSEGGKEQ